MMKPRLGGGMGAPNFKGYYAAVLLDQLKFWWSPSPQKIWSLMEVAQLETSSAKDLLLAVKLGHMPLRLHYPTIDATLNEWRQAIEPKYSNAAAYR